MLKSFVMKSPLIRSSVPSVSFAMIAGLALAAPAMAETVSYSCKGNAPVFVNGTQQDPNTVASSGFELKTNELGRGEVKIGWNVNAPEFRMVPAGADHVSIETDASGDFSLELSGPVTMQAEDLRVTLGDGKILASRRAGQLQLSDKGNSNWLSLSNFKVPFRVRAHEGKITFRTAQALSLTCNTSVE